MNLAIPAGPAPLAAIVADRGIRSVLILLSRFSRFAGPSLIAADIAETLAPLGAVVTVAALGTTGAMASRFSSVSEVIDLGRDPAPLIGRSFDLVITQGWSPACFGLLECAVHYRYLVVGSFSGLTPGEAIFGLHDEADVLLFHSARNRDLQAPSLEGCKTPRLVYGNPLPSGWFADVPPPPAALRRVVAVSNHLPPELHDALALARAGGLEVDTFGTGHEQRRVAPDLVDRYDVVVSIGHTAQKAMARRRPFYCYDHFGGPGYITPETVEAERYICFSGRSDRRRKSPEDIAVDLVGGFAKAALASDHLWREALEHHRLERVLAEILAAGRPSAPRTCRTPRHRNLRKIFQLGFHHGDWTPFVRNIGFDYEATPVLLRVEQTRLDRDHAERITVAKLPPYIFASREPSPVSVDVQVTFRREVVADEMLVDLGDGNAEALGDARIAEAQWRVSRHRQRWTIRLTFYIGVDPLRATLSARIGGGIVPMIAVKFVRPPHDGGDAEAHPVPPGPPAAAT